MYVAFQQSADSITLCGVLLYRFEKKNDVVNDDDEDNEYT